MAKNKVANWFKVDNSAKIYPITAGGGEQNLFRLSAELSEEVDPALLSCALSEIMPRYPSFQVKLSKSVFSYIFEENYYQPPVFPESDVMMRAINPVENKGFLFRTAYFRNIVSIEYFHVLTDGLGGIEFLKALILRYLQLRGYAVSGEGIIPEYNSPPLAEELEDSFDTYYKPFKLKELNLKSITGSHGQSFIIKGVPFDTDGIGVINFQTEASDILRQAKARNATLTAYLTGLLMYSIYKVKFLGGQNKKIIQVLLPINLRKIFHSVTLKNFTFMSKVTARAGDKKWELQDFIDLAGENLKRDVSKEKLELSISAIGMAEKNFWIKLVPLPLKYIIIKTIAAVVTSKAGQTATLTSPGIIPMPESMKPYVEHFNMYLFPNRNCKFTVSALTYNGELSCSFCRRFMDTEIEKFFIRHLTNEGAQLNVSSNFKEFAREGIQ